MFEHTEIVNGNKTMTITIDQDIELLGGVQAGMSSKGFDTVWLSDEELRVQHFHNQLEALLAEQARERPPKRRPARHDRPRRGTARQSRRPTPRVGTLGGVIRTFTGFCARP